MIGGVFRQGGLPDLPDSVTLSAVAKFCHLDVSRWNRITHLAGVGLMLHLKVHQILNHSYMAARDYKFGKLFR